LQHDIAYLEKSVKANTMLADMLFVKYNSTTDEKLRNELSGKVIEHYNQAITIYPEHIHAINNLGVLYANIGQYEKAIKQIRKAISLGANSPENYFNLAAAYEISGDVTTAINLYHKTIELDSKYDPARKRLEFLTGTNN
jgi:tetratricopeptide (TPR) repeat protein